MHYAGDDAAAGMDTWKALRAKCYGLSDNRLQVTKKLHATDACGPDFRRECAAVARSLDVPITTHLAESQCKVDTVAARFDGRTLGEYLDWLDLLTRDLLAARCISSTDDGLRLGPRVAPPC